jgi:hypothetical protein
VFSRSSGLPLVRGTQRACVIAAGARYKILPRVTRCSPPEENASRHSSKLLAGREEDDGCLPGWRGGRAGWWMGGWMGGWMVRRMGGGEGGWEGERGEGQVGGDVGKGGGVGRQRWWNSGSTELHGTPLYRSSVRERVEPPPARRPFSTHFATRTMLPRIDVYASD